MEEFEENRKNETVADTNPDDDNGETIWPATAQSGRSGENAVENDLQIDSFEIRDEFEKQVILKVYLHDLFCVISKKT